MECIRLGADPTQETGKLRVVAQALDVGQSTGEFGLGVTGVDRAVADLVKQNGRPTPTALEDGREMMAALATLGWDLTPA